MEDSSKQQDEGNHLVNKICNINGCLSSLLQSLLKCLGFDTSPPPQDHPCQQHPPSTSADDPVLKVVPRPPVSTGKPPQINSGGSA